METDDNNRRTEIADTPYSGGPDKEAIYTDQGTEGDPMQTPRMPTGEAGPQVQVEADENEDETGADGADAADGDGGEGDGTSTEDPGPAPGVDGQNVSAEDAPADPDSDAAVEEQLRAEYAEKGLPDLKEDAKGRGMTGYSQLNKGDLIDLLVTDDLSQ